MLCAVARWQVSKANAKKHLDKIREIVEWVKQNRRLLYFMHSTYCILETEDPSVETWLNIDEDEDREAYDEFAKAFTRSSADLVWVLQDRRRGKITARSKLDDARSLR